jgi:hypothetical protein
MLSGLCQVAYEASAAHQSPLGRSLSMKGVWSAGQNRLLKALYVPSHTLSFALMGQCRNRTAVFITIRLTIGREPFFGRLPQALDFTHAFPVAANFQDALRQDQALDGRQVSEWEFVTGS